MPRPVYIICSESGSEDKRTNKSSIFNVLEKIVVRRVASPDGSHASQAAASPPLIQMRITVVWMREDGEGTDFESQLVIVRTNGQEERILEFASPFEEGKPFFRFTIDIAGVPDMGSAGGIVLIESRIKPAGAPEWVNRQSYPIVFEVSDAPAIEGTGLN